MVFGLEFSRNSDMVIKSVISDTTWKIKFVPIFAKKKKL